VCVHSGNKVIAEYDNGAAPTAPTREYICSGGALLAKLDSSGDTYYHPDQLSNRLTTDSSGNLVAQMGHYPFGDSWYNSTNDKLQFTSYERDSESGNDYALARSYVNNFGRFSSPDLLSGSTSDPQSLNKFAYVLNDPIDFMDPSGTLPLFYLVAFSDPFFFLDYLITGEGATNDGWSAGNFNGDLINWILSQSDQNNPVRVGGNRSGVTKTFGNKPIKCTKTAAQVMADIEANFGKFADYAGTFDPGGLPLAFATATFTGSTSEGSTIQIEETTTPFVPPDSPTITVDVAVQVTSSTSSNLAFATLPGHVLYPATINFSAVAGGPGEINFAIDVKGSFASSPSQAAYYAAGSNLEDNIWNNMVNNVKKDCRQQCFLRDG
jgi:RHS repeat-associated protein